jgi:hypothetical protein
VNLPENRKVHGRITALHFSDPELEKKKKMTMVLPVHRIVSDKFEKKSSTEKIKV